MAVPKSKITKSRRGMRRSHDAIDNDAYVENKDTGELHRPHHIDLKTGMYNAVSYTHLTLPTIRSV